MKKLLVLILTILSLITGCMSSEKLNIEVLELGVTPISQEFTEDSLDLTLMVKGDDLIISKYTLDGTNPATSVTAIEYFNGEVITIGSDMLVNENKILRLYTENAYGTKDESFTYKKIAPKIKGKFTWDNALVYFAITDRFYNGDELNDHSYGRRNSGLGGEADEIATFHGGDIKGMTEKLDYLEKLGVNAIWITAPYEQIHGWISGVNNGFPHYAYHGYYALDYTFIDRNIGTIEEFRNFVDLAHEKGIRIVMDVVVNHAGYNSIADMVRYLDNDLLYGNEYPEDWIPNNRNWGENHNITDYTASGWTGWWGSWIRANLPGSEPEQGGTLKMNLSGLPDFTTETTYSKGMAPILSKKWSMEMGTEYAMWRVPASSEHRQNLGKAPADYVSMWLADWVREFGIDGFRCDTAKHIEQWRWAQVKNEAKIALEDWRKANPNKAGANWDEEFWMTGEHFGFNFGASDYGYFDNGFSSMINFSFPKNGDTRTIGETWQDYADGINNNPNYNVLSYISSHDTELVRGDMIAQGTCLILNPGGVQIYYGDETARGEGVGPGSNDRSRSDMNWGENTSTLSHWQKLGQFRRDNPAVGAGTQTTIEANTYGRSWGENDVVIRINANGETTVALGSYFTNGETVKNAYNGETAVVTNGEVSFTAENGVILIKR